MYQYEAIITNVINGDTIDATIDLGFDQHRQLRFRLYGIKSNGEAAKDKLSNYVLNKQVMIQTLKNKKGKESGEPIYVCVIHLADDHHSINDRMVTDGYAGRFLE